jgi:hypothetical protein
MAFELVREPLCFGSGQDAAITLYPSKHYVAIYISSMPEYEGGPTDEQFFYNAITFGKTRMTNRSLALETERSRRSRECIKSTAERGAWRRPGGLGS